MLSDACFDFLNEVLHDGGLSLSAMEELLEGIKHYSGEEFGYPRGLMDALYGYVSSVMDDVSEGRKATAHDLVWVVQCVQLAYDAPPAGVGSGGAGAEDALAAAVRPTFAPAVASLKWIVDEAVVRRLGALTTMAKLSVIVVSGPSVGPSEGPSGPSAS